MPQLKLDVDGVRSLLRAYWLDGFISGHDAAQAPDPLPFEVFPRPREMQRPTTEIARESFDLTLEFYPGLAALFDEAEGGTAKRPEWSGTRFRDQADFMTSIVGVMREILARGDTRDSLSVQGVADYLALPSNHRHPLAGLTVDQLKYGRRKTGFTWSEFINVAFRRESAKAGNSAL